MAGVTLWLPLCRIWAILFLSIFIGYAAGPKSNCGNSGTPLTIKQNKVQHGELCPVYSDVKMIALCRKAFNYCGGDDVPALNRETCQLYCLFVCLFVYCFTLCISQHSNQESDAESTQQSRLQPFSCEVFCVCQPKSRRYSGLCANPKAGRVCDEHWFSWS